MIQSPFLSICIPTMNRRLELERTLARLLMRGQTSSFQIIVSDNYSADGTPEFLNQMESQEPRLQHIRQSSRVTFDQNVLACVSKATGKYIWVLPDDDKIKEEALGRVLDNLRNLDGSMGLFVNFGHSNKVDSSLDIERVVEFATDSILSRGDMSPVLIRSLSYLGSYISPAGDWINASDFVGSGFIHTGVALNSIAKYGGLSVIAEPLVIVSVGLNTWEANELEILVGGWSLMVQHLDSAKYAKAESDRIKGLCIDTIVSRGSLISHRLNRTYSFHIYRRYLRPNLSGNRNIVAGIIAIIPVSLLIKLQKFKHTLSGLMT
jgi:glycosyltransferase involved in cell wall biosynthesis